MKNQEILEQLKETFPSCWFKQGADFDGGSAVVWSGEGGSIQGDNAFDSNKAEWNFGAHPELSEFVESRGYYWETHDPGTFLLYPI